MNFITLLDDICFDLWKVIDEYLFDSKISSQSIKYLVTLQSLSKLSFSMYKMTEFLRSKRSNNLIDQHKIMHKKMSLHNVRIVCEECGDDDILLINMQDSIVCWKCMNGYSGKIYPRCLFCCYDFGHDINCCIWCNGSTELISINHWVYDDLKTFLICEECIIMENRDGKSFRKALHSFLSIIK